MPTPAAAADEEAPSNLDELTIYPQGAHYDEDHPFGSSIACTDVAGSYTVEDGDLNFFEPVFQADDVAHIFEQFSATRQRFLQTAQCNVRVHAFMVFFAPFLVTVIVGALYRFANPVAKGALALVSFISSLLFVTAYTKMCGDRMPVNAYWARTAQTSHLDGQEKAVAELRKQAGRMNEVSRGAGVLLVWGVRDDGVLHIQRDQALPLKVQLLDGRKLNIVATASSTLLDLRRRIESQSGVPAATQRLVCQDVPDLGKKDDEATTLQACGLQPNQELHLVRRVVVATEAVVDTTAS